MLDPQSPSVPLPIHRLKEFASLTPGELARIRDLAEAPVRLPRHAIIRREGEPAQAVWLLSDGWAASSMLLSDGERQILKLHLPGDMLGTTALCVIGAPDTLTALTPVTVHRIPTQAFGALFMSNPRFAACMFLSAQRERVALMDRLATVGRMSALERLGALLLDLSDRLAALAGAASDSFDLPVTQQQIGDYLGLTGVHVNRMIRQLEVDGIILRDRHRITIPDRQRLRSLAGVQDRRLAHEPDWLKAVAPDM